MTTKSELLELEHAGWDSLCQGNAHEFYGETMTNDGRMVLANGAVMDRDAVVQSLAESPAWDGYSIDDPHLISLGDDARALVYVGTGKRDDGEDFVASMTSVYVNDGQAWRLALYQQTPEVRG